jgi:ATP-dependent DNA helicase RecQ
VEFLEYFGDPQRDDCGVCDHCAKRMPIGEQSPTGRRSHTTNQRLWFAILVVLSGAARTHGRIGRLLLVQLLIGSESKKLKSLRLDRLPTHGRLRQLKRTVVDQLVQVLLSGGWLIQVENTRFRPVIKLSDAGRRLLAQDLQLEVIQSIPEPLATLIARDLTDAEMPGRLESKPTASIDGPSPRTCPAEHDPQEAVESESTAAPLEPPPAPSRDPSREVVDEFPPDAPRESTLPGGEERRIGSSARPPYYWTWRLFADGFSLDDVREIRRLDDPHIFHDLNLAADDNLPVQSQWMLSPEQIRMLEKLMEQTSGESLVRTARRLPGNITHWEMMYFLKCRPQHR